jgi:hypothetical protein
MSPPDSILSTSGTIEDVASFFLKSVKTIRGWMLESPPRITGWRAGEDSHWVFGEDSVVKLRAEGYQSARRVTHQELEAMARREWREHLAFRRGYASWGIVARVEALERRVNTPVSAEVAA